MYGTVMSLAICFDWSSSKAMAAIFRTAWHRHTISQDPLTLCPLARASWGFANTNGFESYSVSWLLMRIAPQLLLAFPNWIKLLGPSKSFRFVNSTDPIFKLAILSLSLFCVPASQSVTADGDEKSRHNNEEGLDLKALSQLHHPDPSPSVVYIVQTCAGPFVCLCRG